MFVVGKIILIDLMWFFEDLMGFIIGLRVVFYVMCCVLFILGDGNFGWIYCFFFLIIIIVKVIFFEYN